MPTENRSSNTEMAAQLSPCPHCGQQDVFVEQLDSDASVVICQGRIDEYSACLARGPVGVQQHECEDQPGHDQAVKEWNKRAAAAPHPDPIAWMVGTAFWWTKEEAERDAAETGRQIVGLGPMANNAEVERLRGWVSAYKESRERLHDWLREERLKNISLRAQLAEAQALLSSVRVEIYEAAGMASVIREAKPFAVSTTVRAPVRKFELGDAINKAGVLVERLCSLADGLSASAEPSALPDPLGCNACAHTECGRFDGPRQVECRAMADNACARPGASS